MRPTMSARRVLAFVCAVGLVVAASVAVADDDKPGYLGIHLQDIDDGLARALQLGDRGGVLVSDVVDDSPAESAGLEDGDVILEFDGTDIDDGRDLRKVLRKTPPGENVEVVVLREGERKTFEVEVGERKNVLAWVGKDDFDFDEDTDTWHFYKDDDESRVVIKRMHDGDMSNIFVTGFDSDRGFMGVHLDDLNEQLGDYFGVDDGEGALITQIVEDGAAEAAGLKAGDVIVSIDDEDIESAADVSGALQHTEAGEKIEVEVKRDGDTKTFEVELEEMPERFRGKHIEFFGDNDNFHVIAPKMLHNMKNMRVRVPRHHEIILEHDEAQDELEEVREELEKLREELEDMRDEIEK